MLEAWLLAVVASSGMPAADAPAPELLEFIGDWSPAEQGLIDEASRQKTAAQPKGKTDAEPEHEEPRDVSR
jgi:hypothetical protein